MPKWQKAQKKMKKIAESLPFSNICNTFALIL